MKENKNRIGFQIYEITSYGLRHSVSKVYPTWLGAKEAKVRIMRKNRYLTNYRY